MYLKCHKRFKDGKEHRYWNIVESVRTRRGVIKRQLLYLGEIIDTQRAQWCSALDVLDESNDSVQQMSPRIVSHQLGFVEAQEDNGRMV